MGKNGGKKRKVQKHEDCFAKNGKLHLNREYM
jgi:hypothetical protein